MARVRIVLFADTHLGFDYPVKPRIERRRRGADFFANFHRVLDYARETRPHAVLHGGDLFFRAKVPQRIVDLVYQDLFEFAGEGIPLLIVPGNHERSILPTSLFLEHPNLYIFDHPRTFTFEIEGARLAFSGFPCRRRDVRARFSSLLGDSGWYQQDDACQLLCLHQTIQGATVGPSGYTFREGADVIPRAELPHQAAAVLSGHIHRQQVLSTIDLGERRSPPVVYPGSIERTSFAERDETKGFYDLSFSKSLSGNWRIQAMNFMALPTRPMEDLVLVKTLSRADLFPFIEKRVSGMDANAIIRLRCEPGIDPRVKNLVTSRALREILPETMNYQFSSDFRV